MTAMTTPERVTERVILDMLHRRYGATSMGARRYVVAEHVAEGVGLRGTGPRGGCRTADFIAQDAFATWLGPDGRPGTYHYNRDSGCGPYGDAERRLVLHGHEVKVSRSDWLRELRDPTKADSWRQYCDRWWLVCTPDVAKPAEMPAGWGLIVRMNGGLRVVLQAPRLSPEPMPSVVRVALMRAIQTTAGAGGAT